MFRAGIRRGGEVGPGRVRSLGATARASEFLNWRSGEEDSEEEERVVWVKMGIFRLSGVE